MIIGIGTDIVEISRIKDNCNKIAERILSSNEFQLYSSYKEYRQLEFLAGRFACKEAIIKALNSKITMKEIDISYNKLNKLLTNLDYNLHISIAHEKKYATAVCIYEE
jgi:holo-[acyl-carrier protein] synthase